MAEKKENVFFGRQDLFDQLAVLCHKRVASLVTCRGRRRVGKSTLIEMFASQYGCKFIKIEGRRPSRKLSNGDELATFARQLAEQTGAEKAPPADWPDAFTRLSGQISDRKWTVVLLDEISWLAHYDDMFADDLKIAWDNVFKKHSKLILVLCGSVSSWICDNIVGNGAYLGRRSLDIVVPELPICECVKFWGVHRTRIAPREIIDVLSITGGIPRYLEEIDPSRSAEENIRALCFRPNAVLRSDFDEMFSDVITTESSFSATVLRHLLSGPKTAAELTKEMDGGKGGRTSNALARLREAGFVTWDEGVNPETGERAREKRYRIKDNYTRFYLKYIEPAKAVIDSGSFEYSSIADFVEVDSVLGLAFENLVVNNYRELIPYLHLQGNTILSAAPYRRRGTKGPRGRKGCQIDLLIQTRRSIYIVEIKRKSEIGREIIAEVDAKVKAITRPDGVSIKTALVYDGHLSESVRSDGYFDALIPIEKLFAPL